MLFRKKIRRSCTYCIHAAKLDESTLLCVKKGVVSADSGCRKFFYDPCKRVPPKPKALDLKQYDNDDFSL